MKKLFLIAAIVGFTATGNIAIAQEDTKIKAEKYEKDAKTYKEKAEKAKDKVKSQQITITKKGDKDAKITVEINGDNITVNGKPLSEFKDGDITINKRNITVWDGKNKIAIAPGDMNMNFNFDGPFKSWSNDEPHAFLGVTTEDFEDGAKITEVTKESAAEKAGLKAGDIITKVNDKKVDGPSALSEVVTSFKPKDEVTVYYKRDGKETSSKAVLGESKGTMAYSFSSPRSVYGYKMPDMPSMPRIETWGDNNLASPRAYVPGESLEGFGDLFPRRQKLGLKIQDTEEGNGVKILNVEAESAGAKAGLQKDDIITEIGGKKVANTDDAREQLQENAEKNAYNIKAKRNGKEMSFDVKIPKKLKTTNL